MEPLLIFRFNTRLESCAIEPSATNISDRFHISLAADSMSRTTSQESKRWKDTNEGDRTSLSASPRMTTSDSGKKHRPSRVKSSRSRHLSAFAIGLVWFTTPSFFAFNPLVATLCRSLSHTTKGTQWQSQPERPASRPGPSTQQEFCGGYGSAASVRRSRRRASVATSRRIYLDSDRLRRGSAPPNSPGLTTKSPATRFRRTRPGGKQIQEVSQGRHKATARQLAHGEQNLRQLGRSSRGMIAPRLRTAHQDRRYGIPSLGLCAADIARAVEGGKGEASTITC